jgi:hypothetical protein
MERTEGVEDFGGKARRKDSTRKTSKVGRKIILK